jgi:hypothetical protein
LAPAHKTPSNPGFHFLFLAMRDSTAVACAFSLVAEEGEIAGATWHRDCVKAEPR